MGRIIGIDFGTTNSLVSYIENSNPKIIPNDYNEHMTPSVVGQLSMGQYTVGKVPKRQYILKPSETVIGIKRLMGSDTEVVMGDIVYLPQQISSIIIKDLKKYAEKYIGEEVTRAVITVPAGFNDLQRRAIKEAGELAGLKIEGIINEPTAAALAYGADHLWENKNILVYDLGGGTLDVSVGKFTKNILDIKVSRGNNRLGGRDFDKRIIDFIIGDFLNRYGIDLRTDVQAMARIEEAAEIAKMELSSVYSTNITLPFIYNDKDRGPISIDMELTRDKLNFLTQDLVYLTEKTIMDVLEGAGCGVADIDIVIPVGGSTKLNCIGDLLNRLFGDKVRFNINPDEAVALGAAIYAGIKAEEIPIDQRMAVLDRCSYSIGISIAIEDEKGVITSGIFDPVIHKDTRIPCIRGRTYYTLYDNQTRTEIKVYQGESKYVDDNLLIGKFPIKGIPKGPAGREKIEISFSYDSNGILEITAEIASTGYIIREIMNTLKTDRYMQKFEEEIRYCDWEKSKLAYIARDTILVCENMMKGLRYDDAVKMEKLLKSLKKAIIIHDIALIEKYEDQLIDFMSDVS